MTYEMQYGWQTPTCLPKVVDSWIYAEMRNEALINSGQPAAFTPEQIAYYRNGGPNCKWIEEIYKKNAPQQSHNLSFSGGNDKTTFLVSLGYMDQNSMFKGPDYGQQRYNGRLNLSHKVSDRLILQQLWLMLAMRLRIMLIGQNGLLNRLLVCRLSIQ